MDGEKKIFSINLRLGETSMLRTEAVAEFQGTTKAELARQWFEERLQVEIIRLERAAEKLKQSHAG